MSEVAAAEAAPAPAPIVTPQATIHDAIDALFAEKEKTAPAAAASETTETAPEVATTETTTEALPDAPAEPAKLSASDYAIQLAKEKKKLAKRLAAVPAQAPPNADIIKRAAAIEAAGGDPIKRMKAAGIDLAEAVRAHENDLAQNPEFHDPLAKEVKALAEKLAHYEARERVAQDEAATSSFFTAAEKMISGGGDKFEYVAAHGPEGLEVVKQLVLEASKSGEVLPLAEALKMAENHYGAEADKLAKTKKLAAKFATPTRKPGLPQQAASAAPAPAKQTKPLSVSDVINNEIDALLG